MALYVPDPNVLADHLHTILKYGKQNVLKEHEPADSEYWKSTDLAHVALHLSGLRVWDIDSPNGGSSVTPNRLLSEKYMHARGSLTIKAIEQYLGVPYNPDPSTKLLIGLAERISENSIPATHKNNEGPDELIATSMRLTDFDPKSQGLTREIFGLDPDFDTEFVHKRI